MPKISYQWIVWVFIVAWLTDKSGWNALIFSTLFIVSWNTIGDMKHTFGFVSRRKYDELDTKLLMERLNYQEKLEEIEEKFEAAVQAAVINGRNSVFKIYVTDPVKFTYHLNKYKLNNSYSYSRYNSNKEQPKSTWRTVLGVSTTANEIDVKKAYTTLAKRYHPDTNKDSDAIVRMQEINMAKAEADKHFAKQS